MTTFTKVFTAPTTSTKTVNVSRNGEPFGQLWTWKNTRTEQHPWHAKPLNGEHEVFKTLAEAKDHMRTA
jgi:hypothetical protein